MIGLDIPGRLVRSVADRQRYNRALKHFRQSLDDGEPVRPRSESPLIIVGMHRSGTSLLARLLEDLGVAMGKWRGKNNSEAMFFWHRNKLLFSLARASWDNPDALLCALDDPDWRRAFARVAACDLETVYTLSFLPPKALARFVPAPNPVWGFKDPRTSLTLPVWRDIFPNAKIINIVRDGNAVASSLYERSQKWLQDGLPLSLVTLDRTKALSLWAEYVLAARNNCATLPPDRYHEIRYENLIRTPELELLGIAEFAGLNVDSGLVQSAALRINRSARPVECSGNVSQKAQKALELYEYL